MENIILVKSEVYERFERSERGVEWLKIMDKLICASKKFNTNPDNSMICEATPKFVNELSESSTMGVSPLVIIPNSRGLFPNDTLYDYMMALTISSKVKVVHVSNHEKDIEHFKERRRKGRRILDKTGFKPSSEIKTQIYIG